MFLTHPKCINSIGTCIKLQCSISLLKIKRKRSKIVDLLSHLHENLLNYDFKLFETTKKVKGMRDYAKSGAFE